MTLEDMKKVYRAECISNHPDRHPPIERNLWESRIKDLNNAWEILSNERIALDEYLDQQAKSGTHDDTTRSDTFTDEDKKKHDEKARKSAEERKKWTGVPTGGGPYVYESPYSSPESPKEVKSNTKKIFAIAIIAVLVISIAAVAGLDLLKTTNQQPQAGTITGNQVTNNQNENPSQNGGGSTTSSSETSVTAQPSSGQPLNLCESVSLVDNYLGTGYAVRVIVTPSGGLPPYHVTINANDHLEIGPNIQTSVTTSAFETFVTPINSSSPIDFGISDSYNNRLDIDAALGMTSGFQQLSIGQPLSFCETISPALTTATIGQSVPITITPSGIPPPYHFTIYNADDGTELESLDSSSSLVYSFIPKTTSTYHLLLSARGQGTYSYTTEEMGSVVTVGNSNNPNENYEGANILLNLLTQQAPQLTVSPTETTTSIGQTVQFVVTPNGGMQPYYYQTYDNGQPLDYSSQHQSTPYYFTYLPTSSGSHELKFWVDTSGGVQTAVYAEVYVNP